MAGSKGCWFFANRRLRAVLIFDVAYLIADDGGLFVFETVGGFGHFVFKSGDKLFALRRHKEVRAFFEDGEFDRRRFFGFFFFMH